MTRASFNRSIRELVQSRLQDLVGYTLHTPLEENNAIERSTLHLGLDPLDTHPE